MKNLTRAALLAASLLCAGGCTQSSLPPGATPVQSPAAKASAQAVSAQPSSAASTAPRASSSSAPAEAGGLHGTVAERIDVPNYTYLRIKTDKGDTWAAVPTNPVKVGTEVTVVNPVPMEKFESKALNRTFDVIMFASGVQVAGEAGAPPPSGMPANPHTGKGPTQPDANADLQNIKVAKAAGPDGRTVAEVFEQSKSLKDKPVVVRAKVVKVTSGVLDRNWLHLRDGSGSDATGNNDLVVTTTEEAKVNDEITVTGTVRTDKNLGSGYNYPVLVEDAKITR